MTNRTLINLSLILLVGILAIAGKNYLSTLQTNQPNAYIQGLNLLDKEKINEITITRGNQKLDIYKTGSDWKVGTKSADTIKVSDLLTSLYPSTSPILVTESEEQRNNLGLSENMATKVVGSNGQSSITFLVGQSTGSDTVVAISGQTGAYGLRHVPEIELQADPWFDLTVTKIESETIQKMTYVSGKNTYTVGRKDNLWSFENDSAQANSDGLTTFTMKLNPLNAISLAFDRKQKEYNLKSPEFSWIITEANGDTRLDFYKGKNNYLVKRSPNEEYFIIDKNIGDSFNETKDKFVMPQN